MRILYGTILCLSVLMLSACEQENAIKTSYKCENGKSIGVIFANGEQVELEIDSTTYVLPRDRSKTGAHYDDGEMYFTSAGIEARLEGSKYGPSLKCRRG